MFEEGFHNLHPFSSMQILSYPISCMHNSSLLTMQTYGCIVSISVFFYYHFDVD
jgi:hypothetical protein